MSRRQRDTRQPSRPTPPALLLPYRPPQPPPATLHKLPLPTVATAAWTRFRLIHPDAPRDHRDADPRILRRVTVNYIRHELTTYDALLDLYARSPNPTAARAAIRRSTYHAIVRAYPTLAPECRRQERACGLRRHRPAPRFRPHQGAA